MGTCAAPLPGPRLSARWTCSQRSSPQADPFRTPPTSWAFGSDDRAIDLLRTGIRLARRPGSGTPLSALASVRPSVKARRVAKLRQVPPDRDQRLLRRILGEIGVAQDPARHGEEPRREVGAASSPKASLSPCWARITRSVSTPLLVAASASSAARQLVWVGEPTGLVNLRPLASMDSVTRTSYASRSPPSPVAPAR